MFYVVCIAGLTALTIVACVGKIAATVSELKSHKLSLEAAERMTEEERQNGDSDERKA